ncbi:hypothetical protein HS7_16680 [Sulfolobales archaeon HS-7]|nr:hypothetical protein HS7_16680 [Sulfolobales archaeon HS-7]
MKYPLYYPDGTRAGYVEFDGQISRVYDDKGLLFDVYGNFPIPIVNKITYGWIDTVLKTGLKDGRKRFILYVGSRYLCNIKQLSDDECLRILREFYVKGGDRIYDTWIRSVIRGVKSKRLKPWSLKKIRNTYPELYEEISKISGEERNKNKITSK